MAHYGIDVSSNNPHPINWVAAASYLRSLGSGGQPFAIIKVNQGVDYVNPYTQGDIAEARAAGFAVGGYNMTVGGENVSAQQAMFSRVVGGLPEGFDTEIPNGLTLEQYAQQTSQLLALNPKALDYLNQSEVAEGFPQGAGLWLAEYNNDPGFTSYQCTIHQYTSTGTIPGCEGQFDLNLWMDTDVAFDSFFGITPTVAAPPPPPPYLHSPLLLS